MNLFTQTSARERCNKRSIYYARFNRFEFRVFIPLDWLSYQGKGINLPKDSIHNWTENN